jgi:CubicO group peptidase (beta-lactamase class C family)
MNNASMISLPEDVGLCSERLARIDAWRDKLVADGKLAGVTTVVARRGEVAHWGMSGLADKEQGKPIAADTIFRIYSMTKPITAVAIMMLYEEGRFQLDDPISRFLPGFANQRVAVFNISGIIDTVRALRDITFRDLLTHTSGLTYGSMNATPVDAMYRDTGIGVFADHPDADLMETTERLATLPLLAQPGTEWNYSVASDVLAALVQAISGQRFGAFLHERILGPLRMEDTSFRVPAEKMDRLAAIYTRDPKGGVTPGGDMGEYRVPGERRMESGGGGLVSTAGDYLTFCRMLLNKGVHGGVRLLGRKTVELMTTNHLPGDMAAMGQPRFSESSYLGIGFGLGFSVMLDPAKAQILGTPGEYAWGGAASTAFWVDPVEEMIVIMMTQLMPSSTYPIRRDLRVLSYQAAID